MHGGAKGSGGPRGDRNGNYKRGLYTRENQSIRRAMRAKVREIQALIQATNPPSSLEARGEAVEAGGA
jgi:hypothetical protein